MATGRNDDCPCGSGEKYKKCCETARSATISPGLLILGLIVVLGTAIVIGAMMNAPEQPAGQQIWSEEHGHWHTVGQQTDSGVPGLSGIATPQPPGPVPPGKVWSSEHGHWHDAS